MRAITDYLVYGHGGCYNHGVEAITGCTIELLRQIDPDCLITLSSHFPDQDKEFGLSPNRFAVRNPEGKNNAEVYKEAMDSITENTIALHVGGDNYCYKNWQRYADIHYEVKRKGGKSILWGCSIDKEAMDDEMLCALKTHDLILAREEITYRVLLEKGITQVEKVSDIAFSLKEKETVLPFDHYIAVNLSPLVCRKNETAKIAVKQLLDELLHATDYNIVLVPHVVMPMDNDYEVLKELSEQYTERMALVSDKLSAAEYKYIIAHSDLCVASRTHATIAAYSSSVPVVAIGYSVKARGIAEDLGQEKYVTGIESITGDKLVQLTRACLQNREQIIGVLRERIPEYRKKIINDRIVQVLKEFR